MAKIQSKDRFESFASNPTKAVWTLAVPVMMGMLVQTAYSITDMVFVGRISPDAITALAFNMPLFWFSYGITFGLGNGVTAVIAQNIGRKDKASANNAAEHGLLIGLILGVIFASSGLLFGEKILTVMGAPANLMSQTLGYFRIIAGGFIFSLAGILLRSIFNGEGDTMTPMKFQAVATVVNVILDPIFIFGLDMGVKGAALATILSQLITTFGLLYIIIIKKSTFLSLKMRHFKFNRNILISIAKIGIPSSLAMVVMSLGNAVFNKILVGYSPKVVAGFELSGRLDQIFFLPIMALGHSLVTLVGMFTGAQRIDLVKKVVFYGLRTGLTIGITGGIIFYFFSPHFFQIFTKDPLVIEVAVSLVRTLSFFYWIISIGMLSGRMMQGMGYGLPPLIITLIRVILISIPLTYYFTQIAGKPYYWVWYSIALSATTAGSVGFGWLWTKIKSLEKKHPINLEKQVEHI
jgi:putative MATE family efflux protein